MRMGFLFVCKGVEHAYSQCFGGLLTGFPKEFRQASKAADLSLRAITELELRAISAPPTGKALIWVGAALVHCSPSQVQKRQPDQGPGRGCGHRDPDGRDQQPGGWRSDGKAEPDPEVHSLRLQALANEQSSLLLGRAFDLLVGHMLKIAPPPPSHGTSNRRNHQEALPSPQWIPSLEFSSCQPQRTRKGPEKEEEGAAVRTTLYNTRKHQTNTYGLNRRPRHETA